MRTNDSAPLQAPEPRGVLRGAIPEDESSMRRLAALGMMTAGLAHDLGNHLQVIANAITLIRCSADGDQERTRELTRGASEAVKRAAALARRIVQFPGDHGSSAEGVDIAEALNSTVDFLRWAAGPNVRLQLVLGGDVPSVSCDRREFEDAILNLVINAREAMPDGGDITITCHGDCVDVPCNSPGTPGSSLAVVAVRDTGPGMPEEALQSVLEPFFTTKSKTTGGGLGLALVRQFACRSGGCATVESRVGVGTTVGLRLPAAVAPEPV